MEEIRRGRPPMRVSEVAAKTANRFENLRRSNINDTNIRYISEKRENGPFVLGGEWDPDGENDLIDGFLF